MKKIYFIILLLLGTTPVFAQITRELDVFRELEVTDKINVKIVPSTFDKIIITGELADQVEVIQVNDILRLKMTGSYLLQGDKVNIQLFSSKIKSINVRKGSQVMNEKSIISNDSIFLSSSEGASIDIMVDVKDVKVTVLTGGSIMASGKAENQEIEIAMGGSYLARTLDSQKAVVRVSAGGKALVSVSQSIDALTRAGGIIDVYGNPIERKQKRLAGGKITFY